MAGFAGYTNTTVFISLNVNLVTQSRDLYSVLGETVCVREMKIRFKG